jgi:uncharacterized membrane protein (UPF0182 family)
MALGGVAVFFIAMVSLRGLASFYTDFLWFDSLGHRDVFTSVLGAQVVLLVLLAVLFSNLFGNLVTRNGWLRLVRPPAPKRIFWSLLPPHRGGPRHG